MLNYRYFVVDVVVLVIALTFYRTLSKLKNHLRYKHLDVTKECVFSNCCFSTNKADTLKVRFKG
jgi:hypothetical protein